MALNLLSRLRRSRQSSNSSVNDDDGPTSVYDQMRWNKSSLHLNITGPVQHSHPVSSAELDTPVTPLLRPSPTSSVGSTSSTRVSPGPVRTGPSNLAWLSVPNRNGERIVTRLPVVPPIAAQRSSTVPMIRTVSLPVSSSSSSSPPAALPAMSSPLSVSTGRPGVQRLHTSSSFSRSTQSLDARAGVRPHKPLSPIVEQDYFSPESLRRTRPLPSPSEFSPLSHSTIAGSGKTTPGASDIARPSPVLSQFHSPFLSRPLNRTASQSSSRTHISSTRSTTPPSIPPLDLRPPFPGPHPSASYDGDGPPLRPLVRLPTIEGSVEEYTSSELASLHAESFFTASDSLPGDAKDLDSPDDHFEDSEGDASSFPPLRQPAPIHTSTRGGLIQFPSMEDIGSRPQSTGTPQPRSPPSVSESFIARRWDRFYTPGASFTRPPKSPPPRTTPAFWTFWLGFIFPVLWLVGGWHFTYFGEQPPKMGFWEFYFNVSYLRAVYCCRRRRRWGNKGKKDLVLPHWVDEKREYHDAVARLNEKKGSMKRRGFLFGYPFVPSNLPASAGECGTFGRALRSILKVPLHFFDQLYGIKLTQVKGRGETGRRIFDPWIQYCRYATCFLLIFALLGTMAAAIYLLVVNVRGL